jgi:hypothetical protein
LTPNIVVKKIPVLNSLLLDIDICEFMNCVWINRYFDVKNSYPDKSQRQVDNILRMKYARKFFKSWKLDDIFALDIELQPKPGKYDKRTRMVDWSFNEYE